MRQPEHHPTVELFPSTKGNATKVYAVAYTPTQGLFLTPTKSARKPFLLRCGEILFTMEKRPKETPTSEAMTKAQLRMLTPISLRKAAFTALHLFTTWATYQHCPRCANILQPQPSGARLCTACNLEIFPPISPAVIVGIICDGKLLITRYSASPYGYRGPALVAGYCAPGETFEETCIREAREETNLELKGPFHYFASQPWGLSNSLLAGFFVRATKRRKIKLNDHELAEATWFTPEECQALLPPEGAFSLTMQMIQAFSKGEIPNF